MRPRSGNRVSGKMDQVGAGVAVATSVLWNRPQTTHHRNIPGAVIITRKCHAFEGYTLAVISSIRRRGVLLFLASLPDGSRSLIPAAWTDWQLKGAPPISDGDSPHTLGALTDLLQARVIIDALLNRLAESARQKESSHAIELGVSRAAKSAPAIDRSMGSDRSRSSRRSARDSRAPHRPHARGGKAGEGRDQ
jgi:hypothetical protein